MPPVRKTISTASICTSAESEAEASRLRALLAGGLLAPGADLPAQAAAEPDAPEPAAEGFDWSVTLDNVGRMAALLREHGAQLAAAEARAEAAEARAVEAETWLRRLHQAVLDGLPVAKSA